MQIKIFLFLFLSSGWLIGGPLADLCKSGLAHHPKIQSRIYQEKSKTYLHEQGIDQYLPQISLRAETGYKKYVYQFPRGDQWKHGNFHQYTFSFRQALYRPVLLKKITDARLRLKLARLQTTDEKANLVTQIALTSIELLRLRQIRELAQKKSRLYKKAYRQIRSTFNARFTDKTALAQARARLTKSVAEVARYNQMYRYTLNNLKFLTNQNRIPDSLIRHRFNTWAVRRRYHSKELSHYLKMIEKNTRVRIYREYRDIAKNMIDTRRAEHLPSLDLTASYNDIDHHDPTEAHKNSRIALQFNLPIYQGGYVRDRVNEAQALYYASVEDLDNALLESRVSMRKNWEEIQTGLETIRALREAERAGKTYYESTLSAFKNGLQSLTDTYNANIDYYNTVAQRINAQADLLSSILKLYYIAGVATPNQIAKFEKRYLH